MKTVIFTLIFLGMASFSHAAKYTCKYKNSDIGEIIGKGISPLKAYEDAAEKCFDRHQLLTKRLRGPDVAKKRGALHIDICANISCS